ncbi:MAG: hypothetical protein ACPGXL_10680, partial [Chitinophagales bacterium]
QWGNGATTASTTVVPTSTTLYMVTVTDANGCTDVDEVLVTINNAVANAGSDQTVCLGQSATLTATGGGTYAWSNGQGTPTITVSPNTTTVYTVTVTDNNGCTDTDQVIVNISDITANAGDDQSICLGESTTLNVIAPGAVFYAWSNGQGTPTITVAPTTFTAYTVTVTNAEGCTAVDQVNVFVNQANANAGLDQTICVGESATLNASGGVNYQWNMGATTATTVVNPTTTTVYT